MLPIRVHISDFVYREILDLNKGEGKIIEENGGLFLKVGAVKVPVSKEANLPVNTVVSFSVVSSNGEKQIVIHSTVDPKRDVVERQGSAVVNSEDLGRSSSIQESVYENKIQEIISQIVKLSPELKIDIRMVSQILVNWFKGEFSLGIILGRLREIFSQLEKKGLLDEEILNIFKILISNSQFVEFNEIKSWINLYRENLEVVKKMFEMGDAIVKDWVEKEIINRVHIVKLLSKCNSESVLSGIKIIGLEEEFKFLLGKLQEKLVSVQILSLLSSEDFIFAIEIPIFGDRNDWLKIYLNLKGEQKKGKNGKLDYSLVAISLNLAKIGRMWIMLRNLGDYISCYIKAEKDETYRAFIDRGEELKEKVRSLGFSDVHIYVDKLLDDELGCFLSLLRGFDGLEMLI